jgi:hypothetical protein
MATGARGRAGARRYRVGDADEPRHLAPAASILRSRSACQRHRTLSPAFGSSRLVLPAEPSPVSACHHRSRRLAPDPSNGVRSWSRITPAPGRASPVGEGIIKGATRGTPDPVGRNPRPRIGTPPARSTVRPPLPRNPSAVPLARVTGYLLPPTAPTIGHWVPRWTIAILYLHNTGRRTRADWSHVRSQRVSLCRHGDGQSKRSRQRQSENAL